MIQTKAGNLLRYLHSLLVLTSIAIVLEIKSREISPSAVPYMIPCKDDEMSRLHSPAMDENLPVSKLVINKERAVTPIIRINNSNIYGLLISL